MRSVDAEIDAASIRDLISASDSTILVTGPVRTIPRSGVVVLVRWYYDVWERSPQVRAGLFGRGVVAVSALGLERIRNLPDVMGDDLVLSEAFLAAERRIVDAAHVTVHAPKTVSDLYRRRVRAAVRAGDFTTWRRDESSRRSSGP